MPRVVLDTNVIISGLLFGGAPRALLDLAIEGLIDPVSSPELLAELERVLETKFPHTRLAIQDTMEILRQAMTLTVPAERLQVIADDPSDDRVLECAMSSRADAIVSGDTHLLALKRFRGIPIVSPQAFLAHWRQQ